MRRKVHNRNIVAPDILYKSEKVGKLINYIMERGKKNAARSIVYGAFDLIKEKTKTENPLEVFENALKNTAPLMEVKSRRVGGANYQVPIEVHQERRGALAIRWIVSYARGRGEKTMTDRLAGEILDAANNRGNSVKKKEDTHRMADANKAFAHYKF